MSGGGRPATVLGALSQRVRSILREHEDSRAQPAFLELRALLTGVPELLPVYFEEYSAILRARDKLPADGSLGRLFGMLVSGTGEAFLRELGERAARDPVFCEAFSDPKVSALAFGACLERLYVFFGALLFHMREDQARAALDDLRQGLGKFVSDFSGALLCSPVTPRLRSCLYLLLAGGPVPRGLTTYLDIPPPPDAAAPGGAAPEAARGGAAGAPPGGQGRPGPADVDTYVIGGDDIDQGAAGEPLCEAPGSGEFSPGPAPAPEFWTATPAARLRMPDYSLDLTACRNALAPAFADCDKYRAVTAGDVFSYGYDLLREQLVLKGLSSAAQFCQCVREAREGDPNLLLRQLPRVSPQAPGGPRVGAQAPGPAPLDAVLPTQNAARVQPSSWASDTYIPRPPVEGFDPAEPGIPRVQRFSAPAPPSPSAPALGVHDPEVGKELLTAYDHDIVLCSPFLRLPAAEGGMPVFGPMARGLAKSSKGVLLRKILASPVPIDLSQLVWNTCEMYAGESLLAILSDVVFAQNIQAVVKACLDAPVGSRQAHFCHLLVVDVFRYLLSGGKDASVAHVGNLAIYGPGDGFAAWSSSRPEGRKAPASPAAPATPACTVLPGFNDVDCSPFLHTSTLLIAVAVLAKWIAGREAGAPGGEEAYSLFLFRVCVRSLAEMVLVYSSAAALVLCGPDELDRLRAAGLSGSPGGPGSSAPPAPSSPPSPPALPAALESLRALGPDRAIALAGEAVALINTTLALCGAFVEGAQASLSPDPRLDRISEIVCSELGRRPAAFGVLYNAQELFSLYHERVLACHEAKVAKITPKPRRPPRAPAAFSCLHTIQPANLGAYGPQLLAAAALCAMPAALCAIIEKQAPSMDYLYVLFLRLWAGPLDSWEGEHVLPDPAADPRDTSEAAQARALARARAVVTLMQGGAGGGGAGAGGAAGGADDVEGAKGAKGAGSAGGAGGSGAEAPRGVSGGPGAAGAPAASGEPGASAASVAPAAPGAPARLGPRLQTAWAQFLDPLSLLELRTPFYGVPFLTEFLGCLTAGIPGRALAYEHHLQISHFCYSLPWTMQVSRTASYPAFQTGPYARFHAALKAYAAALADYFGVPGMSVSLPRIWGNLVYDKLLSTPYYDRMYSDFETCLLRHGIEEAHMVSLIFRHGDLRGAGGGDADADADSDADGALPGPRDGGRLPGGQRGAGDPSDGPPGSFPGGPPGGPPGAQGAGPGRDGGRDGGGGGEQSSGDSNIDDGLASGPGDAAGAGGAEGALFRTESTSTVASTVTGKLDAVLPTSIASQLLVHSQPGAAGGGARLCAAQDAPGRLEAMLRSGFMGREGARPGAALPHDTHMLVRAIVYRLAGRLLSYPDGLDMRGANQILAVMRLLATRYAFLFSPEVAPALGHPLLSDAVLYNVVLTAFLHLLSAGVQADQLTQLDLECRVIAVAASLGERKSRLRALDQERLRAFSAMYDRALYVKQQIEQLEIELTRSKDAYMDLRSQCARLSDLNTPESLEKAEAVYRRTVVMYTDIQETEKRYRAFLDENKRFNDTRAAGGPDMEQYNAFVELKTEIVHIISEDSTRLRAEQDALFSVRPITFCLLDEGTGILRTRWLRGLSGLLAFASRMRAARQAEDHQGRVERVAALHASYAGMIAAIGDPDFRLERTIDTLTTASTARECALPAPGSPTAGALAERLCRHAARAVVSLRPTQAFMNCLAEPLNLMRPSEAFLHGCKIGAALPRRVSLRALLSQIFMERVTPSEDVTNLELGFIEFLLGLLIVASGFPLEDVVSLAHAAGENGAEPGPPARGQRHAESGIQRAFPGVPPGRLLALLKQSAAEILAQVALLPFLNVVFPQLAGAASALAYYRENIGNAQMVQLLKLLLKGENAGGFRAPSQETYFLEYGPGSLLRCALSPKKLGKLMGTLYCRYLRRAPYSREMDLPLLLVNASLAGFGLTYFYTMLFATEMLQEYSPEGEGVGSGVKETKGVCTPLSCPAGEEGGAEQTSVYLHASLTGYVSTAVTTLHVCNSSAASPDACPLLAPRARELETRTRMFLLAMGEGYGALWQALSGPEPADPEGEREDDSPAPGGAGSAAGQAPGQAGAQPAGSSVKPGKGASAASPAAPRAGPGAGARPNFTSCVLYCFFPQLLRTRPRAVALRVRSAVSVGQASVAGIFAGLAGILPPDCRALLASVFRRAGRDALGMDALTTFASMVTELGRLRDGVTRLLQPVHGGAMILQRLDVAIYNWVLSAVGR